MKVFYNHLIPLSSMLGYCTKLQSKKGELNMVAKKRHTLAWFKECVFLSLCGSYTSRKRTYGLVAQTTTSKVDLSLKAISNHQIQPAKSIPEFKNKLTQGRCSLCREMKRTACIACLKVYCYECGREHLEELISQHTKRNSVQPEDQHIIALASITYHSTETIQITHDSDTDSYSNSERENDSDSDSDSDI